MVFFRAIPRLSPRLFRRYGILILGLGMLAGSARATTTYCAACVTYPGNAPLTQSVFATAVAGLTASGLIAFPTLGAPEDEYTDPTTQVEFLGYNKSGTTEGSANCLTVNGTLSASNNGSAGCNTASGEVIEIVLPSDVVALEVNISSPSGASSYCLDPAANFGSSDCNYNLVLTPTITAAFGGLVNATPFSTAWIGPVLSTTSTVAITSFEVFTDQAATPEGPTMLLLGSGLTALFWLHRRRRQRLLL
jgi:hypothetical protein